MKTSLLLCLTALRDSGPQTVSDLARLTGLSRPTVDAAVVDLCEQGIAALVEQTPGGRDAGRPARVFSFVPEHAYAVGVDVGLHSLRVMITDMAGHLCLYQCTEVAVALDGSQRLKAMLAVINQALKTATIAAKSLSAITIAVPGIVAADGRLTLSHMLPEWADLDIAAATTAKFACPVRLENDIRLAALAEQRLGAARLAEDVVYVLAGHRVAVSLILGGKLHRGRHNAAGEVGVALFKEVVRDKGEISWTTGDSAEQVFAQAKAGNPQSQQEVAEFIALIAPGISALVLVIDPDVVVFGGGLSGAGAELIPALSAAVNAQFTIPIQAKLVASELGAESVVSGALVQALEMANELAYGTADLSLPDMDVKHTILRSRTH